jgi:hypothetical protein
MMEGRSPHGNGHELEVAARGTVVPRSAPTFKTLIFKKLFYDRLPPRKWF